MRVPRVLCAGRSLRPAPRALHRGLAEPDDDAPPRGAELYEHECVFTPFYADGLLRFLAENGLLDFTTLGGRAMRMTEAYLLEQGLTVDDARGRGPLRPGGHGHRPRGPPNVRGRPVVLVQEGMTDPEDWRYHLVRRLPFRDSSRTRR